MKITIYIPAYNAADTLDGALDHIPEEIKERVYKIIVVDNARTNRTSQAAQRYKNSRNAKFESALNEGAMREFY